ncbi:hypothetical protein AKJ64_04715 [candidate division MSBL1 archaeon SCGC-AAA259E17]|uniref:Uncharacterized protein n=1 Tax=candidate division MSBL1 archaeon SCGC-AAA259E17 TaxID=1698263 RepID=A0A133UBB6_9EURY|nr:hypothetical protein AKJ64_04715 [candidate division MSBL1 archaeon SCGC-AAA259E17]
MLRVPQFTKKIPITILQSQKTTEGTVGTRPASARDGDSMRVSAFLTHQPDDRVGAIRDVLLGKSLIGYRTNSIPEHSGGCWEHLLKKCSHLYTKPHISKQ